MYEDIINHEGIAYVKLELFKSMYELFDIAFKCCMAIKEADNNHDTFEDCIKMAIDAIDRIDNHSHPLPFHPHPDGKING